MAGLGAYLSPTFAGPPGGGGVAAPPADKAGDGKIRPYSRGFGQLDGINNKFKVMKRMAYGYRDSEFFFLKIKAAFPGNP